MKSQNALILYVNVDVDFDFEVSNNFDHFWDKYVTDNINYLESFGSFCLI